MLTWLIEQANKVYDWFSGSYWSLVGTLKGFGKTLSNAISTATTSIKNWAQGIVNGVKSWATTQFTAVYNTVLGWVAAAKAWAAGAIQDAKDWLLSQVNVAVSALNALIASVKSWASGAIETAKLFLQTLLAAVEKKLTDVINGILKKMPGLDKLVQFFTVDALGKLKIFLTTLYQSLVIFFQNPMKFVFEAIWGRFLEFCSFVIAYAMGTEIYELPPIPDWLGSSGGGGSYYSPGALNNPCTPVWISGYSFNNPVGHMGVDLGIQCGQEIYAAHDGVIESAGWSTVGYGNDITITSEEWWTRYGHLNQIIVGVGQKVDRGQLIAYGDTTGNSTGCHLHFEVKHNGVFVDPMGVIGG